MHHSNETFLAKCLQSTIIYLIGQTGFTVTDIGEGPGLGLSLFLDQTAARRAKKNFLVTAPPPPIKGSGWLGAPLISRSRSSTVKEATFQVQHFVIHIYFLQYVVYYRSIAAIMVCAVDCKTGVSWWPLKACLGSIHVCVYIWLNPCLLGSSRRDTTQ